MKTSWKSRKENFEQFIIRAKRVANGLFCLLFILLRETLVSAEEEHFSGKFLCSASRMKQTNYNL